MADESKEEAQIRPLVGVGVIIVRDGKVLIGERLAKFGSGSYLVPGGHLEFGESCKECVRKEVHEETGLIDLHNIRLISINNHVVYDRHYINMNFVTDCPTGEPIAGEPHKVANWTWTDPRNLPKPLFIPTERAIEDWLENRYYKDYCE